MNSEDLIAKYSNQTLNTTNQNTPSLPTNNIAPQSKPDKKEIYYSQNSFKRFMGYMEPDYLRVAGLYASMETSYKSKMYGNFLVKKADYVAEALGWKTVDGELDTKRAQNAIRTACRTKAPNGLFYMYSMSNRNHYLSRQGGSRLYMSGRRYQELLDEQSYMKNKASENATEMKVSEVVSPQITQDYQRMEYMLKEAAERLHITIYNEGAINWMVGQFIQEEVDMKTFEYYCDLITSDWYRKHYTQDRYCPRLLEVFDIHHKYKNIMRYANRKNYKAS